MVLTPILVAWTGIGGAPLAMCISVVAVTMWVFPSAVRHGIQQIREKP